MSTAMKSAGCGDGQQSSSSIGHQLIEPTVKPFKAELDFRAIDWTPIDLKKYICDQCLDEFIHESSLTTHLTRRSVRITYLCDKCKAKLTFFNRCSLLSHIRSHNPNRDHTQRLLSQAVVQPIDLNQLFASNTDTTAFNNNTTNNCVKDLVIERKPIESIRSGYNVKTITTKRLSDDVNSFPKPQVFQNNRNDTNERVNSTSSEVVSKKYVIKKTTNSELKCSQCNHSFNSLSTREQHLSDKHLVLPLNQCKLCPTICATNCSQSIHNSLHSAFSDSDEKVCPECGTKLNDSQPVDLMTHLIANCVHFSRRLVYKCMFCPEKMSTLPLMAKHIKSDHTTQQYQCSQCLLQLDTDLDVKQHQTDSECKESRALVLHKCPICKLVVNSVNTYSDHLTGHRKRFTDIAYFEFVCLDCDKSFVIKSELKSHLNNDHINSKTSDKNFMSDLIQKVSIDFNVNVGVDCVKHINKSNDKTDEYLLTNSINSEKRNSLDLNGKNSDLSDCWAKRSKTVKSVNQNNSESHCEDNKKSTNDTQKATTADNSLKCSECGLYFPFVQTLKRHLILEHRIHDVESHMSKTYVEIAVTSVPIEPQLPKEVGEERLSKILDSQDSNDTICPICCQKFSDSKELKIHGRVHGMAFIKSCQKKSL